MKKKTLPKRTWKNWGQLGSIMLITIVLLSFFNSEFFSTQLVAILSVYAAISSFLLNIFQQNTTVLADTISSGPFSISIKSGCDAITPMILYIVTMGALPFPWKDKFKGIILGTVLLFLLNIVRIVSLFLIGKYGSKTLFDIMHVQIWQVLFIAITIMLWYLFVRRMMIQKTA